MHKLSKIDSAALVDRLQVVFGAKDDTELSRLMGQKRSTVGNWRNRGSVPYTDCVEVAEERGISLDWLLTGVGPMRRGISLEPNADTKSNHPREQALLALWRELDEDAQREIQQAAEEKKRLTILEQRVAELEAVVADGKRLA